MINYSQLDRFKTAYSNLRPSPINFLPGHKEEWKPINSNHVPDIKEGAYEISTHGRIRTNIKSPLKPNGGILPTSVNSKGYHQKTLLRQDGKQTSVKINRIVKVAFDFVPGAELLEVDHIDGNKDNNNITNLDWVNPRTNTMRGIEVVDKPVFGNTRINNRVLTEQEAESMCKEFISDGSKTMYDLAGEYNVSIRYVENILTGVQRPYLNEQFGTKDVFYDRGYKYKRVNSAKVPLKNQEEIDRYIKTGSYK